MTGAGDHNDDKISLFQAAVSLFKCVVGTGSFYLPYGILQSGLYGGGVGLLVMCAASIYMNWIIMDAKWKKFADVPASYYDLCRDLWGPAAGILMYISIVISNAGSCSVYLVTMSQLLQELTPRFQMWEASLLFLAGELVIAWLPSFKYLSWTSILGDIGLSVYFLTDLAVIAVLWYGFSKEHLYPPSHYPGFVLDTYPVFFSTAAFLYIQPSTLFPIMNSMKEPKLFNRLQAYSYVGIGILNASFAILAYMFFGEDTRTALYLIFMANFNFTFILLDFPLRLSIQNYACKAVPTSRQTLVLTNLNCNTNCTEAQKYFFKTAQGTLIVDVFFTFPMIMAPVFEIIENSLFVRPYSPQKKSDEYDVLGDDASSSVQNETSSPFLAGGGFMARLSIGLLGLEAHWKKGILRTILLLFTGAVGILIPHIDILLGLITGATLTFNGFIMGPLCHLKLQHEMGENCGKGWIVSLIFHGFIIVFGMALGVWTVYLSFAELVHVINNSTS